jgi:hypothetical protein
MRQVPEENEDARVKADVAQGGTQVILGSDGLRLEAACARWPRVAGLTWSEVAGRGCIAS